MAIDSYDPLSPPAPQEWLAVPDQRRIDLVLAYHHATGERGENEQMHCLLHAIVENQVAMGDRMPVGEKIRQLMAQGLDRHQAVHAIAIVLATHMRRQANAIQRKGDDEQRYFSEVRRMNARKFHMAIDQVAMLRGGGPGQ